MPSSVSSLAHKDIEEVDDVDSANDVQELQGKDDIKKSIRKPSTLGDSVEAGMATMASAMIEVARISAAAKSADASPNEQMNRIEKLLEQQIVMNAQLMQILQNQVVTK